MATENGAAVRAAMPRRTQRVTGIDRRGGKWSSISENVKRCLTRTGIAEKEWRNVRFGPKSRYRDSAR